MEFHIRGEKMEITPSIRTYIISKVERLDKYFQQEDTYTAHVKIQQFKNDFQVEVTIPMKQLTLRSEISHPDLMTAVDLVVTRLERQIQNHKKKINRKWKEKGTRTQDFLFQSDHILFPDPLPEPADEDAIQIVRHKRYELQLMDREEAVLQMNMLGHSFYLFIDALSGHHSAVYVRKNNTYGFIETH